MTTYPEMAEALKNRKRIFYIHLQFEDHLPDLYGPARCRDTKEAGALASTITKLAGRGIPYRTAIFKKKVWFRSNCSASWNTHLAMARVETGIYEEER